uniref:Uncharacterized protein n=1 Tax=Anopheles atroparvus TaxID=41427 RepID=A0AAG5D5A3_ANOAO
MFHSVYFMAVMVSIFLIVVCLKNLRKNECIHDSNPSFMAEQLILNVKENVTRYTLNVVARANVKRISFLF